MTRTKLTIALAVALMSACGSEPYVVATGTLTTSGARIGIVTDGEEITAYVCDGTSIAAWFSGAVIGGEFDLDGRDGSLSGAVAPDAINGIAGPAAVTGTLTLTATAGDTFSADGTTDPNSGIWLAEAMLEGEDYVAGWVVSPDGSQTGALAVRSTGTIVQSPTLSITDGSSNTIVGTLDADRIVSPRD